MKESCFKGCFCSKAGFTLIELLVIVLIIGILAAVAVPQYRRAVLKSEVATLLAVGRAVRDAQNMYYLANATYASNLDELDIDVECPKGWVCEQVPGQSGATMMQNFVIKNADENFGITFTYDKYRVAENLNNKIFCWAVKANNEINLNLCKSYGPDMRKNPSSYMAEIVQ